MDIILVPGFWLNASAWDAVTPPLVAAGHTVHPMTLPGMESVDADRSAIGLQDHVDAVVAAIDGIDPANGKVALVGHSAGGGLVYAASDRRPDRVAHVVYVDSGPMGEGQAVDATLGGDVVDHDLPPWNELEEQDLVDLTDELREKFRARAIPQPGRTVREGHHLTDERRLDIPSTVIACEFPEAMLRGLIEQGHPFMRELAHHRNYTIVDLPTGHWPMFTKPDELATAILDAVQR
jgi:pimeloyl-ACP methyl ester carboxylesterase